MPLRRHVKVGVVILLFGLAPLLYTTYRAHSHNWNPLSVPVILTPGNFQSPDFKTDLTGTYVVSLAFDGGLDFETETCMIGGNFIKGECGNVARTLYLDWSVDDGTRVISAGQYEPHGFSSSFYKYETEIGSFEAKQGKHQKIVLKILSDGGELNAAHPKLTVEAHRVYWEQWIILGQLAFFWAITLGSVGAGFVLIPLLFHRHPPQMADSGDVEN